MDSQKAAMRASPLVCSMNMIYLYSTITTALPLRPKTSGEYISSALAGGTMNRPGVVALAMYVYW